MDLEDCFYTVSLHPGDCGRFVFSKLACNFEEPKIINLKNAALLSFDAADIADTIIHSLRSVFPSWSIFKDGIYSLITLALLLLEILLFLPIVIKPAFNTSVCWWPKYMA